MPGPAYDAWIEKHMQRHAKPDGYCLHCGGRADRFDGPITITIDADENETHEFCTWECLGHWTARAAGGVLIFDEPNEFDFPEDQPPPDTGEAAR